MSVFDKYTTAQLTERRRALRELLADGYTPRATTRQLEAVEREIERRVNRRTRP